jgi:hypothetical protein
VAISRRRLIVAGIAVPILLVARRGAEVAGDAVAGAVRGARPGPTGTSATRCAQCGSADHTMLDPVCPLAPKVLS